MRAPLRVGVNRSDLFPKANALGDVVEEFLFVCGRGFLGEFCPKSRARQGVGHGGVTGDAERVVIALGSWPGHPPFLPSIKIRGRGFLSPRASDLWPRLVRVRNPGVRLAGASERRSHRPKSCGDAREERSQSKCSQHRGVHGDGLLRGQFEYTSSGLAATENSVRAKAKIL